MEKIEKIVLVFILSTLFPFGIHAEQDIIPWDAGTLEALIDAHSKVQKFERIALGELTTIEGEHISTQSQTSKYNEIKTTINQRMSDFNSYLLLAASLTNIATKIYSLATSYIDFTKSAAQNVLEYPLLMQLYTETCKDVGREVDRLWVDVTAVAGYQTNMLKATMKEKHDVLNAIKARLSKMEYTLENARFAMRCMINNKSRILYPWDLAEGRSTIMNKVIQEWNANLK